jgi:hypothetical protein
MTVSKTLGRVSFFVLLGGALLLRLQNWHPFLVVDEDTILTMVWGLHSNPLPHGMPLPLPGYPPLFIYFNFLLSLLYREVLLFLGVFSSSAEFLASSAARDFTLKAGQVLVAVLGTLHVAVIWKIGREFFNRQVAWLAALLIAFHPHLVLNGHIFKSDVPLALLFSLLLLFSLRFHKTLGSGDFYWAAFLTGMTAACKYNGAVEVFLLPFLLWLNRKELPAKKWRKLLLLSPLFGLLGFITFAPNWAVHPLDSFRAAYRYAIFHFQEFTFYDQVSSTYGRYLADLWQTFGPLFLLFFLTGLLVAILRRKKEEITIVFSILLYFIVQGRSVFYGSRIILPILGAIALITAKGACQDLFSQLKNRLWQRAFLIVVFAGTLFFVLGNLRNSISLFNLWKTTSVIEEASSFRNDHISLALPFGREAFTPRREGDRGYWDILGVPDDRFFQGPHALPFLSTGILADHLMNNSANTFLKERLRFRLREYRPFHTVSKPRFGPWDGNIVFWYRPHPRLRDIHPNRERISLPHLFRPQKGSTLFFPLQSYEKDPGFFSLPGVFFGKWILSPKPLENISVTLFSPEGEVTAKVKVNGREILITSSRNAAEYIFSKPAPLPSQRSPLYRIEVRLPEAHSEAFLLIQEQSSVPASKIFRLSSPLEHDPPELFSAETPPGWVKELYRRTGIDVQLLSMTQEVLLWANTECALGPFVSEWMIIPRGIYRFEMEVEPLLAGVAASDPPPLAARLFNSKGFATRALTWEKKVGNRYAAFFENPDERIFLRVQSDDVRQQNLLIRSIRLHPDYLGSFRRGLVLASPGK